AAVTVFTALAQTPPADKSLTFEVASIKPASFPTPGNGPMLIRGPSGGPGTKDPRRINYPFMSLKQLLTIAYDVKNHQISGPSWLDTERFDITATMPPDTTKEQFRIMLQNLLAERFKMTVHREKKELPMYSLVVAKTGKLKESVSVTAVDPDAPMPPPPMGPPKMGPDGFPILPDGVASRPGIFMMMMPGRARVTAHKQPRKVPANGPTNHLTRRVIDNTRLTAKYDFVLTYAPDPNEGPGGRGGLGPASALVIGERRGPGPGPGGGTDGILP